ncbi:hypothetical protein RhiirC2_796140, partial [Rhizophagus irregularis]
FSDIPQDDLPENETTDIPIFNVPETIPQKIISSQPERQADRKNTPLPNISKNKKADKQDDLTQALFDYVAENIRAPVVLTSGTSETSKLSESIEFIIEVVNLPPKEIPANSSKPINEVSMETDFRMCGYAEEMEENPKEYMDMTVWERLIGEEIIRRSLEKDGITSFCLDTDEEWKKTVSTLQENGMLW